MFSINLATINQGISSRNYTLKPDDINLQYEGARFDDKVEAGITFKRISGKIICSIDVVTEAFLQCYSCLEYYHYEIKLSFSVILRLVESEYVSQGEQDEVDFIYAAPTGKVNFGKMIRDEIIVSLPWKHKCNPDCKGLCPVCGTNLNKETCDCNRDEVVSKGMINVKIIRE